MDVTVRVHLRATAPYWFNLLLLQIQAYTDGSMKVLDDAVDRHMQLGIWCQSVDACECDA